MKRPVVFCVLVLFTFFSCLKDNRAMKSEVVFTAGSAYYQGKLFNGTMVDVFSNGQLSVEQDYKNGEKHGKRTEWLTTGQVSSISYWKNGEKHGKNTSWYEHGEKQASIDWKTGKIDGQRITWYENGQLRSQQDFKNDQKHGKRKTWDQNGRLRLEEHYDNRHKTHNWRHGILHGKRTAWGANGELELEEYYIHGDLIREQTVSAEHGPAETNAYKPFINKKDYLKTLNKKELRVERNTIFAKYGYDFKSEDLKNYFESTEWYQVNPNYSEDLISEDDKIMIEYILSLEQNKK